MTIRGDRRLPVLAAGSIALLLTLAVVLRHVRSATGATAGVSNVQAWWVGDYQSLAAGPSTMYPCWGDTRTGRMQIYTAALTASPG